MTTPRFPACTFVPARRQWLQAAAALPLATCAARASASTCAEPVPAPWADHPLLAQVWDGLDPSQLWDAHAHLVGTGGSGGGAMVNPESLSWSAPLERARRLMILAATCLDEEPDATLDARYVARLRQLLGQLPAGPRLMLFAFDLPVDDAGREQPQRATFHLPNAYAAGVARAHPAQFEWVASIHPYRADAVARLDAAVAAGARGVKWLPSSMNIDPASPRCDAFYRALVRHGLPLIVHGGEELAAPGARQDLLNNPLRVRRPLEQGVRVVVAHAATLGHALDYEAVGSSDPAAGPRARSFDLFTRLMDDRRYERHLFADISAILQWNRELDVIRTLLRRADWHPRLLQGSDFPVPGIRWAFRISRYVDAGWLEPAAAELCAVLQRHNPLLFDLALKRLLADGSARFDPGIFHTRPFFAPPARG